MMNVPVPDHDVVADMRIVVVLLQICPPFKEITPLFTTAAGKASEWARVPISLNTPALPIVVVDPPKVNGPEDVELRRISPLVTVSPAAAVKAELACTIPDVLLMTIL